MAVSETATVAKRPEFEKVALDAGWVVDKHSESTDFGRDGWRVHARWTEGSYPASLAVYDPSGHVARAMSFLADGWAVGAELLTQLQSPGPQRDPGLPLDTAVEGFLRLLEAMEPHRTYTVGFVAEKLRHMLEEARC